MTQLSQMGKLEKLKPYAFVDLTFNIPFKAIGYNFFNYYNFRTCEISNFLYSSIQIHLHSLRLIEILQ